MSTINDLSNELIGWFPKLSLLLAVKLVNRGWRDIRKAKRWGFLRSEANITVPLAVTTGTAAVAQYSPAVTLDATATAAVVATTAASLPVTSRQFRAGAGQIYNIAAWNASTRLLTLDRPYQEASAAASPILLYQCYFPAPSPDFLRWISFLDPVTGYRFRRRNLSWTKEMVDRRDPIRGAFDQPWVIAAYCYGTFPFGATGYNVPVFELWPQPLASIGYQALYQREGLDAQPGEVFPALIPDALLMSRAKFYAFQWSQLNDPDTKITPAAIATEIALYKDELTTARRQDDEIYTASYFEDEGDSALSGPIDANYLQSHQLYYL